MGDTTLEIRKNSVWKTANILRVGFGRVGGNEFWPPPLIPRSAMIPAAARLRDGVRLDQHRVRSSSQHLIVGFHARTVTRAHALLVVQQMKLER